jgi:recombination protein RecA
MFAKKKKQAGLLMDEASLRRRYPDSNLASTILIPEEKIIKLPSRIIPVNYMIGGGIPYGKILETFGEESTGKSLLANDFSVVAQQLGGIVLWNDAEASFDARWAKKNGIDLKKVEVLKDENELETISDWIADMAIFYRNKLTHNEPIFLVGDSIAAWETRTNMETAETDSGEDMGKRSKAIYKMLRKRRKILAKYGICSMFINQVRKKVGATKFEDPDTTPGGMAMRFYADIRLGLYRGKKIKDANDEVVGNNVYFRLKKNKTAAPKPAVQGQVFFHPTGGVLGYDKYFFLPETLVRKEVLQKKGSYYYHNGEKLAKGDLKMLRMLREDNDLRATLLKESKINTPSKTRARIESIDTNMYPVKLKVKKTKEDADEEE